MAAANSAAAIFVLIVVRSSRHLGLPVYSQAATYFGETIMSTLALNRFPLQHWIIGEISGGLKD